jgi:low affinity Fe/Cu permease
MFVLAATGAVCAMLYWEQTELLYVVSTIAMCTFLLVVAFSNLEARDRQLNQATSEEHITSDVTTPQEVTSEQKPAA